MSAESAPVNTSCHLNPSMVITKRFLTPETKGELADSFIGFSGARKHIANRMQAKKCFIV
jgi:hypothetical protein